MSGGCSQQPRLSQRRKRGLGERITAGVGLEPLLERPARIEDNTARTPRIHRLALDIARPLLVEVAAHDRTALSRIERAAWRSAKTIIPASMS